MSKKIFLGSSILYKRPIPKFNSSYNSQIPNSTSNKQTISFNFEDEQLQNNKLISSVRSNILKINEDVLYQNIKNSQRAMNNPKCLSTRLSVNNITNNKLKKNINNGKDKNTLYFKEKDNDNKIFQNYNNNTCNISLNQHFYNIDYNNYTSPNSNMIRNITETKDENIQNLEKFKYINTNPNININKPNIKKYTNFYLNTLTNSSPIYFSKGPDMSHELTESHSNALFKKNNENNLLYNNFNNFNIFQKKNKKFNKINLIKVNNKKKYLNINNNNISSLNNYTNFVKILTHRKIPEKKNLSNYNDISNRYNTKSKSTNNFKYIKKIVNYNSFNRKKDEIDLFNFTMKRKVNNNILNQFSHKNKTHEQISNDDKYNRKMKQINKGNNSLFLNKIDSINNKKKINLNKINNLNEMTKNNNTYEVNYHTTKNINFNKKLNYYIKQKLINKQEDSNYALDKMQGNSSVPLIKNSYNKYNNVMNKNKKNSKNNFSTRTNNDIYDITTNSSAYRVINTNSIDSRYLMNFKNKNFSNENYDKLNININSNVNDNDNLLKNINIDKIDIHRKKIIDFNKMNKSVNFNQNYNDDKIRSKMNNVLFKGQKEIDILKKKFLNHFSNETNNKNFNKNNISLQNNSKLGKKNKINYNFKPKKQKAKFSQSNENSVMNNNSLSELIHKFRQNKKNINKTIINSNNNNSFNKKFVNKKVIAKKKILNKQYNYINQSNSLNNIKKYQKNSNKLPKLSDLITKPTENNNEYMEQSLKLSEYIKDFYLKYCNYPQTNLNFYKIGRLIGQGGFAKVNLGLNVLTGRVVAIKSFNKTKKTKYGDNLNMDKILYEINLMRKLNHPNITKILETFEDEKFYFIIMEYINGGNLFSYVKKRRKLSEKVAKFLFRQIILAIKHIHSQLIVHRDIKLENILIDMNNNVKICDFGIGIILSSEDQDLHSHCGTPMYIAPEIILSTKEKGYKGFPVDIWSAGIALYIMLSGKLPFNLDDDFQDDFDGYNNNNIKEKNKKLKYEIVHKEPKYIEKISDEARNLLNGLLNKNPLKRLTCDQILNHPWFSDINNNKNHLFSKSERALLSKTYIDYRKNKLEDLIENFTISNLFNDKKNTDIEYNNCETKSSLLAPFNSLNYNYFINDIDIEMRKNIKLDDNFDDFNNKNILVEKDLIQYSIKAKEFNFQYELNNNKEVDNGVLINSKSFACSSNSSFSNANTNRNEIENGYKGLEFISKDKIEEILNQIESMGYDRDYVIKSVKKNLLNHASTIFFLLIQYENI